MVNLAIILTSYQLLTTEKRQKEKTKGKCDASVKKQSLFVEYILL